MHELVGACGMSSATILVDVRLRIPSIKWHIFHRDLKTADSRARKLVTRWEDKRQCRGKCRRDSLYRGSERSTRESLPGRFHAKQSCNAFVNLRTTSRKARRAIGVLVPSYLLL